MTQEEQRDLKILISQAKAVEMTMVQILNQDNTKGRFASCMEFIKRYQYLADKSKKYLKGYAMLTNYNIDKLPSPYELISQQQLEMFQSALTSLRVLIAALESNNDFNDNEFNNLLNKIQSKLRNLMIDKPEKEKDVQDNIERLFISNSMNKGIDYDTETGKFNFSGREYIPDFIIPKYSCCVEVKLIKEKKHLKQMIEEINADITAYSKKYDKLVFIVYDLGCIRDVDEFIRDIELAKEKDKEIKVIVIKH